MATNESEFHKNNPSATKESGLLDDFAVASTEDVSQKNSDTSFLKNLRLLVEEWILTTLKPSFIIVKNTFIFGLFLGVDKFILWLITLSLSDNAKIPIVSMVLQWINISSAIIIGFAYVVRLSVELYMNREEFLGISQKKGGK